MKVCYPQLCLCGRNTLVTRLLCWVIMWLWLNSVFIHHTHEWGELGGGGRGGVFRQLSVTLSWPLCCSLAGCWWGMITCCERQRLLRRTFRLCTSSDVWCKHSAGLLCLSWIFFSHYALFLSCTLSCTPLEPYWDLAVIRKACPGSN